MIKHNKAKQHHPLLSLDTVAVTLFHGGHLGALEDEKVVKVLHLWSHYE